MRRVRACLALAMLFVLGCSEDPVKPSDVDHSIPPRTVDQLLSSRTALLIDGTPATAGISIGRSPQSPLGAGAVLNPISGGSLPSISDVYLWVIRDKSEVWATTMSYYDPTPSGGSAYQAEQGPQWDIGIHVDAVLGIRTADTAVRYVLVRDIPIISIE